MKTQENLSKQEAESGKREDIFCNKCGMSCRGYYGNNNGVIESRVYFNGIIKEKVVGGYDSTHIQDGDIYVFSLCENCLKQLIDSFSLSAYYGNYMFPEPNTGYWNELPEEQQFRYIGIMKDNEIIDFFDCCNIDYLIRCLKFFTSLSLDELSKRDEDVVKLLKQFLDVPSSR